MKAIGGNARDLKVIAHKGSAEAITNLLGGHIDLVTTAAGNIAGHVGVRQAARGRRCRQPALLRARSPTSRPGKSRA